MTDHALFDQAGEGPAVMLVHAGIADRRMWRAYLPWLAEAGWLAIAPDLPGFGAHAPAADPPAPWDFLRDVLDELGVDRAVIVGNSFGRRGGPAPRRAPAPERVRGLAMISSPAPGMEPSPQLEQAWTAESDAMERGDIDGAVDAVVAAWLAPDAPAELRELVAAMQRRAFELDPEGTMPQAADPSRSIPSGWARSPCRHSSRPASQTCPTSRGARGRWPMPSPALPTTPSPVPGHLAPLEAPDAFRALLTGFLAGLDG